MSQLPAQDLLAALTTPALVCLPDGAVVAMNEVATDWLEISAQCYKQQSLEQFIHSSDENLIEFLRRCERDGQATCSGRVFQRHSNSARNARHCHAQLLHGMQIPGCMLLVFTKVDPITHIRAQCGSNDHSGLNTMNTLGDVALGVAHEASQPLTAIATYADSCRRWLTDGSINHPKLLSTVDKIIEQAHVTGQMINCLKSLAKGNDDVRRTCDLNQLVGESLDVLALDPRCEHCVIESQLQEDSLPVSVCPVQIKIVLLNLFRNALEASLAKGLHESRVRVSVCVQDEHWVSAMVTDTGRGIAPETRERLFQPFQTSKPDGLGLGLIISRWLATAHAGRIEHMSNEPNGACFQLLLPLARQNTLC